MRRDFVEDIPESSEDLHKQTARTFYLESLDSTFRDAVAEVLYFLEISFIIKLRIFITDLKIKIPLHSKKNVVGNYLYTIYYCKVGFFLKYSFVSFAATPESTIKEIQLGIAIKALVISAIVQT